LHEREKIADSPVVGDPAVAHSHHVDAFKMNFAMSWRNAEKRLADVLETRTGDFVLF
jgi:hypothetical protein